MDLSPYFSVKRSKKPNYEPTRWVLHFLFGNDRRERD
jgi:hypothetical protein